MPIISFFVVCVVVVVVICIIKHKYFFASDTHISPYLIKPVKNLISAKRNNNKIRIKKAEDEIYSILSKYGFKHKKCIPRGLTEREMNDPILLAKIISCIAKVKSRLPDLNPFALCRASLYKKH